MAMPDRNDSGRCSVLACILDSTGTKGWSPDETLVPASCQCFPAEGLSWCWWGAVWDAASCESPYRDQETWALTYWVYSSLVTLRWETRLILLPVSSLPSFETSKEQTDMSSISGSCLVDSYSKATMFSTSVVLCLWNEIYRRSVLHKLMVYFTSLFYLIDLMLHSSSWILHYSFPSKSSYHKTLYYPKTKPLLGNQNFHSDTWKDKGNTHLLQKNKTGKSPTNLQIL